MHMTLRIATPEGQSIELCRDIVWESAPIEGRDYPLYPGYDLYGSVMSVEQRLVGNAMKCFVGMRASRNYDENDLPHVVKRLEEHGWTAPAEARIDV